MGFIGKKISIVPVLLAILLVNNALAFNVKKDSVRLNLRSHISPLSVIYLKEVNKCGGGYCVLYEKSHRYTFVTPESFMVKIADGDAQVVGTPFKTGCRETDNGVIYEDKEWRVTFLDQGEWGTYLWFKDKERGKEYLYEVQCSFMGYLADVDRLDDYFHIATSDGVVKINVRNDLPECPPKLVYDKVKRQDILVEEHFEDSPRLKEYMAFENDGFFSYSDSVFLGGFVYDNRLYHVVKSKQGTFIGFYDGKHLQKIFSFGKKMHFYRSGCMNGDDAGSLLLWYTVGDNDYGLVEIHCDTIRDIRIFHDLDRPSIKGDDKIMEQLDFLVKNWDSLNPAKIWEYNASLGYVTDNIERKAHKIGYPPDGHNDDEKFYILEWYADIDKDKFLSVSYRIKRGTDETGSVFMSWEEKTDTFNSIKKNLKRQQLCSLLDTFAGQAGEDVLEPGKIPVRRWSIGTRIIELEMQHNLRLLIY